jgi:hypothetical protein
VAYDHSNHFDGLNKARSGPKDRLSKKLHRSLPILKMARYLKISIERPLGSDGFEKVARDVAIGYTRAGGGSVDETVGRNYSAFEQNYGVTRRNTTPTSRPKPRRLMTNMGLVMEQIKRQSEMRGWRDKERIIDHAPGPEWLGADGQALTFKPGGKSQLLLN